MSANSNQFTNSPFSYDASGNVLADGTNTYAWNAESEIKTATGVNYTYDGDGDRVQKSNGKIYWFGAGSEILDESDSSGNITDEYIFFGGKRIAHRVVSGNAIYYYAEDFLGSSRVMTTSAGTVCYDADFYPYGGERVVTNTCPQNYKFTGKERDAETNNDDFGARYYSSQFGRWISPDWSAIPAPVPYANLTNPQTLNLYAMVHDNPETFSDLDGHGAAALDSQNQTTFKPWGRAFNGQGAASVTTTQTTWTTTTTTAADGTTTQTRTETQTQTSAYYSLKHGGFLGATQSTTTTTTSSDGTQNTTISPQATLNYAQATQAIGAANMTRAAGMAQPGVATGFIRNLAQDAHDHPFRMAGRGLQVVAYGAMLVEPPTSVAGMVGLAATFGATAIDVGSQATGKN